MNWHSRISVLVPPLGRRVLASSSQRSQAWRSPPCAAPAKLLRRCPQPLLHSPTSSAVCGAKFVIPDHHLPLGLWTCFPQFRQCDLQLDQLRLKLVQALFRIVELSFPSHVLQSLSSDYRVPCPKDSN